MEDHGLIQTGWTFDFDRAKYRLGFCNNVDKKITISKYFTAAANEDEFDQAVLHEIAHALLPQSAGHKQAWKDKAKAIGYRGERLAHNPFATLRHRGHESKVNGQIAAYEKARKKK